MNRKSHRLSILVMSALDRFPPGPSTPIVAAVPILFRVPNNTVSERRERAGGQERIGNGGEPIVRGSEGAHWGRRSGLPGLSLRSFRSSPVDLGVVFETTSSVGNELDGIDGQRGSAGRVGHAVAAASGSLAACRGHGPSGVSSRLRPYRRARRTVLRAKGHRRFLSAVFQRTQASESHRGTCLERFTRTGGEGAVSTSGCMAAKPVFSLE